MDWIQAGILGAVSVSALTQLAPYAHRRWRGRLTERQKEILRRVSRLEYLDTETVILDIASTYTYKGGGIRSEDIPNGHELPLYCLIVPPEYSFDVWSLCHRHGLFREWRRYKDSRSADGYILEARGLYFVQNSEDSFRERRKPSYLPNGIWARVPFRWRGLIGA